LCTPDVVIQGVLGRGNWDFVLPVWQSLHEAYDMKLEIEELVGECELVAARYAETGTFRREFRGLKPTGKSYRVTAMEWFRFEDGKIAERWGARDSATIQRQLAAD
jgi:predicted ester cyclase